MSARQNQDFEVWSVYLLECRDGSFYCGICRDLARRLAQHNGEIAGGARYTRGRRPVALVGEIHCDGKGAALKLEACLKSMPRRARLAFFRDTLQDNAKS